MIWRPQIVPSNRSHVPVQHPLGGILARVDCRIAELRKRPNVLWSASKLLMHTLGPLLQSTIAADLDPVAGSRHIATKQAISELDRADPHQHCLPARYVRDPDVSVCN